MSVDAIPHRIGTAPAEPVIHPRWVRITHWINALAVMVMIGSGWEIYNASPLFAFAFPPAITLGRWLAGGLLLHFAAMWMLVANGLVYLILGIVTGRFQSRLFPIRAAAVLADTRAALTGRLAYDDLSVYNAVQRLFYSGVLVVGIVVVLSGVAIWKPVQFQELTALLGGYDTARYVHFFAMAAIVAFLVIHVIMALVVPKTMRAMIIGR
jgi:thiosulfate reductase cytochrome b subunit